MKPSSMKSKDKLMASTSFPPKTTAPMPVSQQLVAFSTISIPKAILETGIMGEPNLLILLKKLVGPEHYKLLNYLPQNGLPMYKHYQVLLLTLLSILAFYNHMIESWG